MEEAAIFAEHDPEAVERLDNAKRWRRSLAHEAQRLRDEAAEREADAAEVERLRAEGLPVLSAEEVAEADEVLRIERLVTAEGEPLPEEEWPNIPGARVQVVKEWVYPEDEYDEEHEDDREEDDARAHLDAALSSLATALDSLHAEHTHRTTEQDQA